MMNNQQIGIINLGISNITSVYNALKTLQFNPMIMDNPEQVDDASHLILPGVGAFQQAMQIMQQSGWQDALLDHVESGFPLLGICLGMQLLASLGSEPEQTAGLGLIPGKVKKIVATNQEKVPHVGWNNLSFDNSEKLFSNIRSQADFYFVHSYHFIAEQQQHVIGTTPYCDTLVTAIKRENIYGVQFHPEKSSTSGLQLLKNFVERSDA